MLRIGNEGSGRKESSASENGSRHALPNKDSTSPPQATPLKSKENPSCRKSEAGTSKLGHAGLRTKGKGPVWVMSGASTTKPRCAGLRVGGGKPSHAASSTSIMESGLEIPDTGNARPARAKDLKNRELPKRRESSTGTAKSMRVGDLKLKKEPDPTQSGTSSSRSGRHILKVEAAGSACPKPRSDKRRPICEESRADNGEPVRPQPDAGEVSSILAWLRIKTGKPV